MGEGVTGRRRIREKGRRKEECEGEKGIRREKG